MTTLGVFFTRGVSLKQWVELGLFDREVLIYHEHLRNGLFDGIEWFTYGSADAAMAAQLARDGRLSPAIQVVPRPHWFRYLGRGGNLIYTLLMPFLAWRRLKRCDVFKTNQMDGAIAALAAARLLRRPLFVRTGYTHSLFVDQIHASNPLRRRLAEFTEKLAFRHCDAASVSSRFDRDYILERYGPDVRAPLVLGNYIDVDRFSPRPGKSRSDRLIFVGRLSPQKNLASAIRACAQAHVGLDVIGDGPDRKALHELAADLKADVRWLGVFPNERLPERLAEYRFFYLPSLWEGMPKALLEAMAAGLVCIGNDTTGINEVIVDGVTGYLSKGADPAALATAIRRALSGDVDAVSAAARDFVSRNFSLSAIVRQEREIFSALMANTRFGAGSTA